MVKLMGIQSREGLCVCCSGVLGRKGKERIGGFGPVDEGWWKGDYEEGEDGARKSCGRVGNCLGKRN